MTASTLTWRAEPSRFGLSPGFRRFWTGVVIIQGVHVFEHVVQLVQVHRHSTNTFGLLGYVFMLHGTAEWMHLVFNVTYLVSLLVLAIGLRAQVRTGLLAARPYVVFLIVGVLVEMWHSVEHAVIVKNMLENGGGCPCPGILDPVLGVMDAQLHFAYNTVAYIGTLVPFVSVRRRRRRR